MASHAPLRIAVLGASGRVGRLVVAEALRRGHGVSVQTRAAGRLSEVAARVDVHETAPDDEAGLRPLVRGASAVVYALGLRSLRPTTFFSHTTRALVAAMRAEDVRRLVAITGVGAGETRGHGGFVYDRIVFPLLTARMYRDKARQERLIERSDLDWTILRPAPFSDRPSDTPLQAVETVPSDLVLRRIAPAEVAAFALDCAEGTTHLHRHVFFGHP